MEFPVYTTHKKKHENKKHQNLTCSSCIYSKNKKKTECNTCVNFYYIHVIVIFSQNSNFTF